MFLGRISILFLRVFKGSIDCDKDTEKRVQEFFLWVYQIGYEWIVFNKQGSDQ